MALVSHRAVAIGETRTRAVGRTKAGALVRTRALAEGRTRAGAVVRTRAGTVQWMWLELGPRLQLNRRLKVDAYVQVWIELGLGLLLKLVLWL